MTGGVVVVGAGVAGLATAYRLLRAETSVEVSVLEAAERQGGRVATVRVGDLELDAGPESFAARKPGAVELCRELGLEVTSPQAHGTSVWTDRGLVPLPPTALGIPAQVDELARWQGMSRGGRLKALGDLVKRPSRGRQEESVGALTRRRLGDECVEKLVQPILGGLFAGDIDRLGVSATLPEIRFWEREHGALIHGAHAALKLARDAGPMFVRPRAGIVRLPAALVERVGAGRVHCGSPVTDVRVDGAGFVVRAGGPELHAHAVVLATPAPVTARLLEPLAPAAAVELDAIAHATSGVVLLVYAEGTAEALPDAAGFVVPRGKAPMFSATFTSRVWPDPAFGSRAIVRCEIGGVGAEDVVDAPDADIVEAVSRHLAAALPLPDAPERSAVVRWPRARPQYGLGHLERVVAVVEALPPGIFVVGDAYGGVGLADVVRGADETARRVLAHLAGDAERERVR